MEHHNQKSALKRTLDVLGWVLIFVLLAATLWGVHWASKQPKVHSIWGEPSDSHITWNYGPYRADRIFRGNE